MSRVYKPRNDLVIVRQSKREQIGAIRLPDHSADSIKLTVEAFGPDVKDLEVGQEVLMLGTVGETFVPVPGARDLFMLRQGAVACVCEGEPDAPLPTLSQLKAEGILVGEEGHSRGKVQLWDLKGVKYKVYLGRASNIVEKVTE